MRTFIFIVSIISCFYIAGCNTINPHEQIPTYVHLDSFKFAPRGDTVGSSSHKITNVWVYINNDEIGTFTMPVTFPVIADKPFVVRVAPGIDFNGLGGLKGIYPFYTFDSMTIPAQPGKIVSFAPVTKYTTATRLLYNANFDIGHPPFLKLSGSDSFRTTTDPNYVFEGQQAAYLYLDSNKKFSQVISTANFHAEVGQQVFVELNYKCSIPFTVSLFTLLPDGTPDIGEPAGINVHDGWNKIYITVQDFVNSHPSGTVYNIVIRAGTDYDEPNGWVAIDNLKVVAF